MTEPNDVRPEEVQWFPLRGGRLPRFPRNIYSAEYRRRLEAARRRAHDALMALLTEPQRAQYAEHGAFDLIGSAGGRYTIYCHDYAANVVQWMSDGHRRVLCAHPHMLMHDEDVYAPVEGAIIAQMMTLKTDEPKFLRTALYHGPFRGRG